MLLESVTKKHFRSEHPLGKIGQSSQAQLRRSGRAFRHLGPCIGISMTQFQVPLSNSFRDLSCGWNQSFHPLQYYSSFASRQLKHERYHSLQRQFHWSTLSVIYHNCTHTLSDHGCSAGPIPNNGRARLWWLQSRAGWYWDTFSMGYDCSRSRLESGKVIFCDQRIRLLFAMMRRFLAVLRHEETMRCDELTPTHRN